MHLQDARHEDVKSREDTISLLLVGSLALKKANNRIRTSEKPLAVLIEEINKGVNSTDPLRLSGGLAPKKANNRVGTSNELLAVPIEEISKGVNSTDGVLCAHGAKEGPLAAEKPVYAVQLVESFCQNAQKPSALRVGRGRVNLGRV